MLRLLFLRLWPALIPIILYLLWIFVMKKFFVKSSQKDNVIDAKYSDISNSNSSSQSATKSDKVAVGNFSLQNTLFLAVVYLSLILSIVALIFAAIIK